MNLRGESGFSLAELAGVVAIIGILVSIAVASYTFTTSRAHSVACESNRRTLDGAVQLYRADNSGRAIDDITDLEPYIENPVSAFRCPAAPTVSLSYNATTGQIECAYHAE
ncbi:MAG: hypothetical protein KGZ89_05260 [Actinobacteria bacterium]|nr:hypothetical protein [Actinomycetota bacterium]